MNESVDHDYGVFNKGERLILREFLYDNPHKDIVAEIIFFASLSLLQTHVSPVIQSYYIIWIKTWFDLYYEKYDY